MDMNKKVTKRFLCIQVPTLIFHILFRISRSFISYPEIAKDAIGIIIILGYTFALLQLMRKT